MQKFFIPLIILFMLSCASSKKQLIKGRYDRAIRIAAKKIKKKPSNEKEILVLEQAYNTANRIDKERIEFLKKEGNPNNWEEIFNLYNRLKTRQDIVKTLPPLFIESEMRTVQLKFENYDDQLINAKKNAAEYMYSYAKQLLKRNDRQSAREAYYKLLKVKQMIPNFKDVDKVLGDAKYLGTSNVIFEIKNESAMIMPKDFDTELRKISLKELNGEWLNFDTYLDTNNYYDYSIIVKLKIIDITPEQVKEREYTETKKIRDGWKYVLDENGNVKKDSAGNDIKVPNYKTISCKVFETYQNKTARVSGIIDFYNNTTKQLLKSAPITSDAIFEHYAATAIGDIRALKDETKKKIGKKPIPFPSDGELIMQAATVLKEQVKKIIYDNKNIFN